MPDDKKPPTPEPTISGGIGETEFNTWKHHPVTRAYLKFLMDQSTDIKDTAVFAWESGKLSLAVADEMRGAHNYLRRSANPDFAEIVKFYADDDRIKEQEKRDDESSDGKPRTEG